MASFLPSLPWDIPIVDPKTGRPTIEFQNWWQANAAGVEEAQDTADNADGLQVSITPDVITLEAGGTGAIYSYATAVAQFKVLAADGTDLSTNYTLSTFDNPVGLTVSYVGQTISVTGGFDASGVNEALLTVQAVGTGTQAGKLFKKTLKLLKHVNGLVIGYIPNANDQNGLVPDAPINVTTISKSLRDSGNVDLKMNFTFNYNSDPEHKNNIDGFLMYIWASTTATPHTLGTSTEEQVNGFVTSWSLGPNWNPIFVRDGAANLYYTIGIAAYRHVHTDVDPEGIIIGPITQMGPYRPETSQNFYGYIEGELAANVKTWASYANNGLDASGNLKATVKVGGASGNTAADVSDASSRTLLAVDGSGFIKNGKVDTNAFAADAINSAIYDEQVSTYFFAASEDNGMTVNTGLTCTSTYDDVFVQMELPYKLTVTNPTNGQEVYFNCYLVLYGDSGGFPDLDNIVATTDLVRVSDYWLPASATGFFSPGLREVTMSSKFTGLGAGTYYVGVRIVCASTNTVNFPKTRHFTIINTKGLE